MSGNSSEPQRTVTSKTVAILLALTTGQNHTLSTIASDTDLPRTTVYRLLRQLVASPLVECYDSGQYRLGPPLLSLARTGMSAAGAMPCPYTSISYSFLAELRCELRKS